MPVQANAILQQRDCNTVGGNDIQGFLNRREHYRDYILVERTTVIDIADVPNDILLELFAGIEAPKKEKVVYKSELQSGDYFKGVTQAEAVYEVVEVGDDLYYRCVDKILRDAYPLPRHNGTEFRLCTRDGETVFE